MNSLPSNRQNANQASRRAPPLPRKPNPLQELLRAGVDIDTLTSEQLAKLRRFAVAMLPDGSAWDLDLFLDDLFNDPAMVIAYFRPTAVAASDGAGTRLHEVLPLKFAREAADRARKAPVLLPIDQMVAWVATFLAPCAIFYSADPRLGLQVQDSQPNVMKQLRAELLDRAVRRLRRGNPGAGDLLAAVLELPRSGDCSGQQVARIKTVVCLHLLHIQRVWTGTLLS